ncbi:hypothetical protein DXG03_001215, partial [Asterophora parasitica]
LMPYLARQSIPFNLSCLDIDTRQLRELEYTNIQDDEDLPGFGEPEPESDNDDDLGE